MGGVFFFFFLVFFFYVNLYFIIFYFIFFFPFFPHQILGVDFNANINSQICIPTSLPPQVLFFDKIKET
ncbi:MAG TPA: hypothetical protein DDY89_11390 [Lysinibacillus sp.]|nr:hypothetical protein [Lysinibacillus sp.]